MAYEVGDYLKPHLKRFESATAEEVLQALLSDDNFCLIKSPFKEDAEHFSSSIVRCSIERKLYDILKRRFGSFH